MTVIAARNYILFSIALLFVLLAAPVFAQQNAQGISATTKSKRVLIISVDGMRPDVLLRADAPNIRELMKHGSYTFWAESTDLALTLPTHVSMLTGVTPARHRITWNYDRQISADTLKVPTLFDLATKVGYSTSMVVGKDKLCIIARPGMVDCLKASGKNGEDSLAIARTATEELRKRRPHVMVVHFPAPDSAGHSSGWGSQEQITVIERTDQGIGIIMSALQELGMQEHTLVILTADHGGSRHSHGAKIPFSRYIPWIAVGPGVRANYDLTRESNLEVHVEDVFATALYYLDMEMPAGVDGKPVRAIFK